MSLLKYYFLQFQKIHDNVTPLPWNNSIDCMNRDTSHANLYIASVM